jgi:hypothetical protein
LAAPVIYFERSRDELGLVRWNRPQNGSTSRAGEKRTLHGAAKPKEIERQFSAAGFVWDIFAATRVHRNIHAE